MPDGIDAQTQQSPANVAAELEAGGSALDAVVRTTVFLNDMDDFAGMNAVDATFFPRAAPARSTSPSHGCRARGWRSGLHRPG